jgi:hypothetical protein
MTYMFLAISSMFMTVLFTPYHPVLPTELPPALQLFSAFVVHCYHLLHFAIRFLAKCSALFFCQRLHSPHVLPLFASAYILSPLLS